MAETKAASKGGTKSKDTKSYPSAISIKQETDPKDQNLFAGRTHSLSKLSGRDGTGGLAPFPSDCGHPPAPARGAAAGYVLYRAAAQPSSTWVKPPGHVPQYWDGHGYRYPTLMPGQGEHFNGPLLNPVTSSAHHFIQAPTPSKMPSPYPPSRPSLSLKAANKPKDSTKKSHDAATKKNSTTSKSQLHDYINPEIIDLAEQLNLPSSEKKFLHQHWRDCLELMYRWKVTDDDVERQRFERSATTGAGLAYNRSKSVKAFCDKVIRRPNKRRQFNIHWNRSGIRHLADLFDHDEEYPAWDSPDFQTILDNFAMDQAKNSNYKEAKELALGDRQLRINNMWNGIVHGKVAPTMGHLKILQNLIEQPVIQPLKDEKGNPLKTNLLILGFNCRDKVEADAAKRSSEVFPLATGDESRKIYSHYGPHYHQRPVPNNEWVVVPQNVHALNKENKPITQNRTSV